MRIIQCRRDFLASAVVGRGRRRSWHPDFTRRRGAAGGDHDPARMTRICLAPEYIAEDLLRAEGFTDIRYVHAAASRRVVASGEIDFDFSPRHGSSLAWMPASRSRRWPACMSAATSCSRTSHPDHQRPEGQERRRPVARLGLAPALSIMAAHVGLDPQKDINWVTTADSTSMELFAEGKVDAFLGLPPEPQELRARKIGRVILNTTTDKPWSQYFCCLSFGNRDFVRDHPIATKRSLRASSRPPTSAPPSRSGPRNSWSMAGSRSATTTRSRR